MRKVPARAPGVVTWSWFIDDTTGHMIVHAKPGCVPIIDVHLRADGQEQVFDLCMTSNEAFRLARQVTEVARAARRAEWTPDVVAYVNETYRLGWDDDDVVKELDKLADYLDASFLLQRDGTLEARADAVLKARWPS